jgi:superoxide dismutase, Cu-Zn family
MRHALLAAALMVLSAATLAAPPPDPVRAIALLRDGAGNQVGTAMLAEEIDGVRIAIGVKGLPPGRHGFHLHEVGRCDPPGFASAGEPFNPHRPGHGPAGGPSAHAGQLPDLVVGVDGAAQVGFIAKGVRLGGGAASLLGGAGTALVLVDGGARIACGVVTRR